MPFYQFRKELFLPASPEELWQFIKNPRNLSKITPEYMNFQIVNPDDIDDMYPGMIISYHVSPLPFYRTQWVTEITQIEEGQYFIDEQRVGPYKIWHHQHHIRSHEGGTMMTDIVSYQPPFGFLGGIANYLFIANQLKGIFLYREEKMKEIFESVNS